MMRNFIIYSTLLLTSSSAIAGDAAAPMPASAPVVRSSLTKRDFTDTCAYLDTDNPDLGRLQSCFCLSGVNAYINSMYADETPARRRTLRMELRTLINDNGSVCTYPTNAVRNCQQGAPCLFSCNKGYTANQMTRTCDCTARNRIDCGGRCVRGTACVSGVPVTRRELALQEASPCKADEMLCGVRSAQEGSPSWECVKTDTNLESCGGCIVPFYDNESTGVDCTTIDADDVKCVEGVCQISSCAKGYKLSANGSVCVPMALQHRSF